MELYISSSTGDDRNDGTQSKPLKTLTAAALKKPAAMFLKAGDTFTSSLPQGAALIASYGSGPRPLISSTIEGVNWVKAANATIKGLHFRQQTAGKNNGIRLVWCSNITIDSCLVEQHKFGINCEGDDKIRAKNFTIKNSIIIDNFDAAKKMASGSFISHTDGITLLNNVYDHNGWTAVTPAWSAVSANIFSHNVYIHASNTGLVATGNIFANAASHGIQCRSGGIIKNNYFVNNPIHQSFGLVNGPQNHHVDGGVTGEVTNNVYVGGRDIAGQPRGIGLEVANIKQATITKNLWLHDAQQGAHAAIEISEGEAPGDVGILDLEISGNVIWDYPKTYWVNPKIKNPVIKCQTSFDPPVAHTVDYQKPCQCCGQTTVAQMQVGGADTSFKLPDDWMQKARDGVAGYDGNAATMAYLKVFGVIS